jgi:hypothetical protein
MEGLMPDIHVYIEGTTRNTREEADFVELRFDGPQLTENSRRCFRIYVEVNALIQSVMRDNNFHVIHDDVGKVIMAFTDRISVYRYGIGADDDQSLLGCLTIISDKRDRLNVAHFGRTAINAPLMRATVEAHYDMVFSNFS